LSDSHVAPIGQRWQLDFLSIDAHGMLCRTNAATAFYLAGAYWRGLSI
jgi:hypothetical protein